jgi:hypothetical protein
MATFDEAGHQLPNHYHDALLRGISVDFSARTARLRILADVSPLDHRGKNIYRPLVLEITGLLIFYLEPPYPNYPFVLHGRPLNASGDQVKVGQNAEFDRLAVALPPNADTYRFFLDDWNSFLYLAALNVEFSWDGDETESASADF